MAIGIVSSNDFALEMERLGLSKPITKEPQSKEPEVIIKPIERGRGPVEEIPAPVRQFIAEEALLGVKAKDLSESLGVSESSVSAYKHGATSTASYNQPEPSLDNHVKRIKVALASKARAKLATAIESLTDDKLASAGVKTLSQVARDMSAVVRNLEPKEDTESNKPNVQFVFFAPKVKEENYFPVVEVNED